MLTYAEAQGWYLSDLCGRGVGACSGPGLNDEVGLWVAPIHHGVLAGQLAPRDLRLAGPLLASHRSLTPPITSQHQN